MRETLWKYFSNKLHLNYASTRTCSQKQEIPTGTTHVIPTIAAYNLND